MRTRIIESCVFVSLRSGIYQRCPTNKEEKVSQIKGPAIFLAQFAQNVPPHNTLPAITQWVKDLGYIGVQIPGWDSHFIDLDKVSESKQYCEDMKGQTNGLQITEIANPLIGQLVPAPLSSHIRSDVFV